MANPEHVEILKQGVEVWNRWRRENSDCSGADLSEAEADLSGASLVNAYLERATLPESAFFIGNSRSDRTSARRLHDKLEDRCIRGGC